MIAFKKESECDHVAEARMQQSLILSRHCPTLITEGFCLFCCVCKLEYGFRATLRKDKNHDDEVATNVQKGVYSMKNMVACTHASCSLHADSVFINSDKFIFSLHQFKGLSCFEIAHYDNTAGLWVSNPNFEYKMMRKNEKDLQVNLEDEKQFQNQILDLLTLLYTLYQHHTLSIYYCMRSMVWVKKAKGTLDDKFVMC